MSNQELLERIEALEKEVASLKKLVPGAETMDTGDTKGKTKRCLPGFNECRYV